MSPASWRRAVAVGCALAAAALLGLSAAGGAAAAYDPVGSGETKLVLAKPFAKLLAENGVRILVRDGARRRGRTIVLSASGGEVDPRIGTGTVENAGVLVFARGPRRLPLREVVFKAKRTPLYAKVGGGQLKLATAARLSDRRAGFGTAFTAGGLRLTAKAASRLGKKLRLRDTFRARQLFASVRSIARPRTVHLRDEGRVQLLVDPAFKRKLDDLFVSLNPIAPAELAPGPMLSFPVGLESTLAPDATSGTLKLGGSAELLQLGSAQVFWREVWLQPEVGSLLAETDVQPAPPYRGPQPQAPLLAIGSAAAVVSEPSSRTIAVSGMGVTLTAAAAATLNEAFAGSAGVFGAGEVLGAISLLVTAE
jgi:hypothetical protein